MHLFSFSPNSTSRRAVAAARSIALLLALGVSNPLLNAQIFTEVGDAGQTPGTAQNTGLSQPFTILGTLSSPTDADVFRITIVNPGFFAASTVNPLTAASGGPGGLDTQLFLFDSNFRPIMMNDDASGTSLQSALPANSVFLNALAAGIYYIAISLAGNDPVNTVNQLVFAMNGGDTTRVRGAATGLNPNSFSDFNGATFFPQQGAYQINIFSVPDSGSTLLLVGVALVAVLGVRARVGTQSAKRN